LVRKVAARAGSYAYNGTKLHTKNLSLIKL
jgi:hypothetical protein